MEVLADDALEATEFAEVFAGDEGDGGARRERAAGTADAVDVVLELVGEVEVEDVRDAVDVDAARGDVGRDEHADLAVLEGLQRALTLALRPVGVDGGAADVFALELATDAVGAVLGAREDEDHLQGFVLQEVVQHDLLEGARALIEELGDGLGGVGAAADLDELRVALILLGEGLDLSGKRGGEHQGLALLREGADDGVDRGQEAHVQHAVGFVEDEVFDGGEVAMALAAEVEEPARGGDEEVTAAAEGGDLGALGDAAVAGGDGGAGVAGIGGDVLGDLDDELAGRGQDQATDTALVGAGLGADQPGQQRKGESGGLAGAGLGDADDILSVDDDRDRGLLDRRRLGVALVGHGFEDGGIEA